MILNRSVRSRLLPALLLLAGCRPHAPVSSQRMEQSLMRSIARADTVRGTVTLPVFRGMADGELVWHIVTESSDPVDATARGVTWSPRLRALAGTAARQRASMTNGALSYSASVDFSPERTVRANPDSGFPALLAKPGSVARTGYSPFVELENGVILNAPIIANTTGALDRVLSLDSVSRSVVLRMSRGYFDDRHAWYISTESSDAQVAAFERATYAPALATAPSPGRVDAGSARSGILAILNGVREAGSPERQGMQSALLHDLSPLNVLQHAPSRSFADTTYSPLWDLHVMQWTRSAIESNQREKIFSWTDAASYVKRGLLQPSVMTVNGMTVSGFQPSGVVINCPAMITFPREAPAER